MAKMHIKLMKMVYGAEMVRQLKFYLLLFTFLFSYFPDICRRKFTRVKKVSTEGNVNRDRRKTVLHSVIKTSISGIPFILLSKYIGKMTLPEMKTT